MEAFAARALGSPLRLHVRLDDETGRLRPEAATAAWNEVRAEFDAVDRALSRFRDDSELTALNRLAGSGVALPVSWRLRETLALMHRASRMTGGRFDPSLLGELEQLGEHGAVLGPVPARARDRYAAGTADTPDRRPLDRPRRVTAPAVPLDTGGIGKGLALRWAARRAAAVLGSASGVLIDAGGDVVAAGGPGTAWSVGIEDPVAAGGIAEPNVAGGIAEPVAAGGTAEPIAVVALDTGAIATSSVAVRRWTGPDGRVVHHLLDPRTREPARTGLLAVTVCASDPAWAEVWTKALFLAGRTAIGEEARARGLAAWWVAADGRIGLTPAARERSTWVAESRVG